MITTKQLVYTIVEIVKHYLIEAGDYSNDLEEQYSIRETVSGFTIDGYYICDYEYIPIFVDESKIPESYEKVNKNNFFSLTIEDCTDIGEVINKISKKDEIKGLDANQFFLSMLLYPEVWKTIPIYKVKDENIKNLLSIEKNQSLFSFNDIYSDDGNYKLLEALESANAKSSSTRDNFDKEIIK